MQIEGTDQPVRSGEANLLIRSLPPEERAVLRRSGRIMTLKAGDVLTGGAGIAASELCFPDSGVLSVLDSGIGNRGVETAMIGSEGMLGWPMLLCDSPSAISSVVLHPGTALMIPARTAIDGMGDCPALRLIVSRFVQYLTVQMATTIAAGLRDTVGARVARRLLMLHDRWSGDVLDVTHQQLAAALGIRRASVTDHLHLLEGEHIVRCTRGRIEVRGRDGLEATVPHGYGEAEAAYRRLLAPFGKRAPA